MQLNIKYNFLILILAILVSAVTSSEVKAQGQVKSIMFTGRVVGVKGTQTLGKAYILIPGRAGYIG